MHTHEPSSTGYVQKQKKFHNAGQIVTWCTYCLVLPVHHRLSGFGVPAPLFIGYLISNLIPLETDKLGEKSKGVESPSTTNTEAIEMIEMASEDIDTTVKDVE